MRTFFLQASTYFLMSMLPCGICMAATYYVSNQGDDKNDGLTPETAWASLERVNREPLRPGDSVLFQGNGQWRGRLVPHSGSQEAPITYSAYGNGSKPLLLGSVSKSNPEDWTDQGDGIWSAAGFPSDVGNIIFGQEETCGVKRWSETDLRHDGDYWCDPTNHVVKLRMLENPAVRYRRVECAVYQHVIDQANRCYFIIDNLAVKYGGAHGVGGGNAHHAIIRNCDFAYLGGCDQYGNDRCVRFGNGIEFWGTAHDILVERCRLWEIYDAALTNQSLGPATPQYNIVYRNNVIWNSEYSFEYWNRPESSETHNIFFVNNTCYNAGEGWGHAQRSDPSGRHLCFYSSSAKASNIVIADNIFDGARGNAFYAPHWTKEQIDALVMDHNCWRQQDGAMIAVAGSEYSMADFAKYQAAWNKEPHSIVAVPRFLDPNRRDFRLAPESPCIGSGANRVHEEGINDAFFAREKPADIGSAARLGE